MTDTQPRTASWAIFSCPFGAMPRQVGAVPYSLRIGSARVRRAMGRPDCQSAEGLASPYCFVSFESSWCCNDRNPIWEECDLTPLPSHGLKQNQHNCTQRQGRLTGFFIEENPASPMPAGYSYAGSALESLVDNVRCGLVEQHCYDECNHAQCRRIDHTSITTGEHGSLGGPER